MSDHAARGVDRSGRLGRFLQRSAETTDQLSSSDGDPLTGLPGREALLPTVEAAVAGSHPVSTRAVLGFVDIGLLRDVNDSYGPDTGDRLLRSVAARLRSIDVPHATAIRYGGAEFAVVIGKVAQAEHAEQIARFLVELLGAPYDLGGDQITIDANVGVAISADTHESGGDLVHDAHQALVRARDEGRGAYVVYDDSRRGRYATRVDEERLRNALHDDEFLLHYQPIIRMDTGEVVGVEALLRWKSPGATTSGVMLPGDFMPLLEKAGLGAAVGEVVLRKGCAQLAYWNSVAPERPKLFLTVNLGARQLADPRFTASVADAVSAAGIGPWQLCLDVTEEALRFNRSGTWSALRELKDSGVKLGLDDYGTGYASMIWLRELRLDLLRIDRVFTAGLGASLNAGFGLDCDDARLIRHTVSMAHDLQLLVAAEGVEEQNQADALASLGVDMGQGFHYGRPADASEITHAIAPHTVAEEAAAWDPSQVMPGS